jgi:hypothetical protein
VTTEETVRALSVRQPWASLIAEGYKTIELRSWFTHYRGPLAIVAARDPDRRGIEEHGRRDRPRQMIVAVANLVDVRPATPTDAKRAMVAAVADGLYAWVLKDVRALAEPVRCSGRQGLFRVPKSLSRELR